MESDTPVIANLCGELGYGSDQSAVSDRLAGLLSNQEHAVFVFDDPSAGVLGWIHVQRTRESSRRRLRRSVDLWSPNHIDVAESPPR